MYKLLLDVAEDGFSLKPGAEAAGAKLEGGASRYRRTFLGATANATASWFLTAVQFNYFMAFHRLRTVHGSQPFQVDLPFTAGQMQTCTAWFVPDSLQITRNGTAYVVQSELEVVPPAEDSAADLAIIQAYEASVS